MADSFFDGCYDPKNTSPDQLYPLLYKTSAAAEITLRQLHFYGTKAAAQTGHCVKHYLKRESARSAGRVPSGAGIKARNVFKKKNTPSSFLMREYLFVILT